MTEKPSISIFEYTLEQVLKEDPDIAEWYSQTYGSYGDSKWNLESGENAVEAHFYYDADPKDLRDMYSPPFIHMERLKEMLEEVRVKLEDNYVVTIVQKNHPIPNVACMGMRIGRKTKLTAPEKEITDRVPTAEELLRDENDVLLERIQSLEAQLKNKDDSMKYDLNKLGLKVHEVARCCDESTTLAKEVLKKLNELT